MRHAWLVLLRPRGRVSAEVLLGPTSPLLSAAYAPTKDLAVGWGVPFRGGPPRAYLGLFLTL